MKKTIIFLCLIFIFTACGKTEEVNIEIIQKSFKPLNIEINERIVSVYLPSDYSETMKEYPIIYMNDGDGIFKSASSWQMDIAMEKFINSGEKEAAIIVGIHNSPKRDSEYVPWDWYDTIDGIDKKGLGEEYIDFIINEVKPYVDSNYRSLKESSTTCIGGSSLGGLISIYAGIKHPEVFGKIMAMSPSIWVKNREILNTVDSLESIQNIKIYLDCGENEWGFKSDVNLLQEKLAAKGAGQEKVKVTIDPEGAHNNESWRRRFPDAYRWLY